MFWRKNKKLDSLRNLWAKPIHKHRNYDLISSYFKLQNHSDRSRNVDDKTWDDLNFDSVFSLVDRNTSGVGQQYLYSLLHKYEDNEVELRRRQNVIQELKDNSELREKVLKFLNNLNYTGENI